MLSMLPPPTRSLVSCFDRLCRLEGRDATTLEDCLLSREQMKACLVDETMLREHSLAANPTKRRRLVEFFRTGDRAGMSLTAARERWCTVDVKNSDAWLSVIHGAAPTVTAQHNSKAIFVTHKAAARFLLPQEHLLLQGSTHGHANTCTPDIAMAYVVMAYVVVAFILMAYKYVHARFSCTRVCVRATP